MSYFSIRLGIIILLTLSTSCGFFSQTPLGNTDNPIKFYLMPHHKPMLLNKHVPQIEYFLETHTGLAIRIIVPNDNISTIQAFGKGHAHIALINTMSYLLAHDWAKAEAHLISLYNDIYQDYSGEILIHTESKINDLTQLQDKKIVYANAFSASGYLYAMKLLHNHQVKPATSIFATSHANAIEMLYNKQVDAAATYHTRPNSSGESRDARIHLVEKYPDIFSKLRILSLTDRIPNAPIAFQKNLPQDIKTKLVGALIEFSRTTDGRMALSKLYNITGFAVTNDAHYDQVRHTITDMGKKVRELVPGGLTFYKDNILRNKN